MAERERGLEVEAVQRCVVTAELVDESQRNGHADAG